MESLSSINLFLAKPLIWLIHFYQLTLSPDHSWLKFKFPHGYCKFHPTCSMYAIQVLQKQGLIGMPKIISRILRCNPFTTSRLDFPYSHPSGDLP